MTITASPSEITYACDSVTVNFPVTFPFDTAADLKVFVTDVVSGAVQPLVVGYSVTGGGGSTGNLLFSVAPAITARLTILDDPTLTQPTDYVSNDAFPAESHERALDRVTRLVKRLHQQWVRTLKYPDGDIITDGTVGSTINRRGKYLFFNAVTGALEYAASVIGQTLSQSVIAQFLFPQDANEIVAGVTPVNYVYASSPKIDVRRHLTAWDDLSDQTAGLQRAVNLAYAQKGRLILPNGLNIKSGAIVLTMPGNRGNQGLAIEGPGWNGAAITQVGSPTALFAFSGSTPTGAPNEAPLVLEGFTLNGVGKTARGIALDGVAYWTLRNIQLSSFGTGIYLSSSLVGIIEGCQSGNNNFGLIAVKNGAGSGCNRNTIRDSQFNANSTQGLYIASGSGWQISGLDIEVNGTAGDLTTGGMRIVSTVDDEFGACVIGLQSLWFEANYGWPLLVDNTSGLFLAIRDSQLLSGEGTREIKIAGASDVLIENTFSPGGIGDIWDITANQLTLKNVQVSTLTDTGVVYPTYNNVTTASGVKQISGRATAANLTVTGMNPAVTAVSVNFYQQGQECTAELTAGISGTSNTTACTLTGFPLSICPATGTRDINLSVTNNGSTQGMTGSLDSTGVLTLKWNGSSTGFTNSGGKGVPSQSFRWRIA